MAGQAVHHHGLIPGLRSICSSTTKACKVTEGNAAATTRPRAAAARSPSPIPCPPAQAYPDLFHPAPGDGSSGQREAELDLLSHIIANFNNLFGGIPWADKDNYRGDSRQSGKRLRLQERKRILGSRQCPCRVHRSGVKRIIVGMTNETRETRPGKSVQAMKPPSAPDLKPTRPVWQKGPNRGHDASHILWLEPSGLPCPRRQGAPPGAAPYPCPRQRHRQ